MRDYPITVLKFGSSVLRSETDLPAAVHEIYRWVRNGHRVIAVVSALGRCTDTLLQKANSFGVGISERVTAALLATGESTSAALLGLALDRSGIPALVFDEVQLGLRTSGPVLDAEPFELDTQRILEALDACSVIVAPGFVGRQADGSIALLGRGGSDLTAVFIADRLRAERCRLIKDVDGIFEQDPASSLTPPLRYSTLSFADARKIDGRVVQQKSIEYANHNGCSIEIASLNSDHPTIIGPEPSALYGNSTRPEPLRVGLLGVGTVGLGVYRILSAHPDAFHITGIGVRRTERDDGTPAELLTRDPWEVLRTGCQVVIELIGGVSPARELIEAALRSGQHVITANKLVIARHGAELRRIAKEHGVALLYSAAVGGGVPMLEHVRQLAISSQIQSVRGVVNGTTNFILDKISAGVSREEAVAEAQRLGFAEQDPTADLDGSDAAHKIALLAQTAFGTWIRPQDVVKRGIEGLDVGEIRDAVANGRLFRLVATVSRDKSGVRAEVAPAAIDCGHLFAQVHDEGNCIQIETEKGTVHVSGKGAGRWPTTESVIADVLEISRDEESRSKTAIPEVIA